MASSINFHDQPPQIDPMQVWISSFTVIYAVSKDSMKELEGTNLLRKSSGEGVKVTKYTSDMLKNDDHLAKKVFGLADKGRLGFEANQKLAGFENGGIQFRNDVAARMAPNQTFRVYTNERHTAPEILHANVIGLDDEAYSSLAGLHLVGDTTKDEKTEKDEERKKDDKFSKEINRSPHHEVPVPQTSSQKTAKLQRLSVMGIGESTLIQQKIASNRHKRAEEKHKEHEEIDRKEVKREVLKREIKNAGISRADLESSYNRANRNFGDRKETDRGSAMILDKSENAKKRKPEKEDLNNDRPKKKFRN